MDYHILPTINALLNTLSTLLLLLGYRAIRRKNIVAHYRYMWSALGTSTLFLISYLTYHTLRQINEGIGHTSFMLEGFIRYLYYTILFSHLTLAFTVVPLALITLYRGWKGFTTHNPELIEKHRRIARWTLPIWLYVSITGVLVYLMLYHIPGARG